MKVLVVDDEAPARSRLVSMLGDIDGYSVCGEAANGSEALAVAGETRPDVVLMDIRMPGMDGLEAARNLQLLDEPPAVIFTTAYDDYALTAFETHAVDYLLKPVRQQRLVEALANANRLTRAQLSRVAGEDVRPGARRQICANVRGSLTLVPVEDIRYFFAEQKYVAVGMPHGEVLIEETLKSLEDEFAERFIRVHRNALAARQFIAGLEKGAGGHSLLCLNGSERRLEVSRRHLAEVRRLVKSLQS